MLKKLLKKSAAYSVVIPGIVLFASLGAGSVSASTDGVTGCWKTISDKTGKVTSRVCLWENNGRLYGKIDKLYDSKDPNPICEKCRGSRKNKPIIGMTIITGLRKGSSEWKNGKILDPENGKWYTCKIWREGSKLKVRGYIAFFYRTQTWVK